MFDPIVGLKNIEQIIGPCTKTKQINVKNIHPHDIAGDLNEYGICIRAGFHCAQPLHEKLGLSGSCRASISIINTRVEIEYFVKSLKEIITKYK